jgi:hypothetical protein
MARIALRPYSPTDPRRITPRDDFAREHALMGEPLFGVRRPDGPCWTLTDGAGVWAQPLACGGFEPDGPGRFSAWLYAGDLTTRQWAFVGRAFALMQRETGARRVEATLRHGPRVEIAEAYARRLGMRLEGLLKSFGPDGADYWLYAGVY